MEFDRQQDGTLNPLPAPSIDTGHGPRAHHRGAAGKLSNYDTDAFTPLLAAIGERAGTTHRRRRWQTRRVDARGRGPHARDDVPHRRRRRAVKRDRGYVLRKIMRRAMRHGKQLGLTEPFLHTLVDTLVREFGDAYPELRPDARRSCRSSGARRTASTRC